MPLPRPRTIKGLIITAALAVTVVLFGGIYFAIATVYDQTVRTDARSVSRLLAGQTFDAMFQVMRKGWSREELETFVAAMRDRFEGTPYSLEIYRGPKVTARFGTIGQPEMGPQVREAFRSGRAIHQGHDRRVRHVYPLRARGECLECHTNAALGDVLGVIEVEQDITPVLADARERFLQAVGLIAPLPLLVALLVAVRLGRRLDRAFTRVRDNVAEVNRVSDLGNLQVAHDEVEFHELNRILGEVDDLGRKLRTFAVDKELLEFEIGVLERFVITSEVVRDWRQYVSSLLIEINEVMETYVLFSIFKIDEEMFDLEIFWRNQPTPETSQGMEQGARALLHHHPVFREATAVNVRHNIADPSGTLPPLADKDIELQSKSLFVETPKIGGIVGIGVQAGLGRDPTRLLVMESVMSTLLNVVGSVKAIYKYTRELEYYATRDPLTGLYNQRIFWELMGYEVSRTERKGGRLALLVMDLDNFKVVNDTYGHHFGDEFLGAFADLLHETFRHGDLLARYGGDEFVALLTETPENQAVTVAERLLERARHLAVATPDGSRARATVSIGIGVCPDHAREAKDLFLVADNMMYQAKSDGKDQVRIAQEEDVTAVYRELGEKSAVVLEALESRRVVPYFQPIVAADGRIHAYEVLSRIHTADGELMVAGEFIEAAERMGVVHRLDFLAMEAAFERLARFPEGVELFINLSPKALILSEFMPTVKRLLLAHAIDPARIVFELTERETVKNVSLLQRFVEDLKLEGFKFAIDDFGSGFSSFHYLKRFPVDYLKIDGDFIVNLAADSQDQAFVQSMAWLARALGITTVAEFVETGEVLEQARAAGVDLMQGYYLGGPTANPEA